MKIVFLEADNLGRDIDLSMFHRLGEVVVYGKSEPSEDAARIRDADIVIANKIPLGEALLKSAKQVKLICLTATGTNVVDFPYVNGIPYFSVNTTQNLRPPFLNVTGQKTRERTLSP